MLGNRPPAKRHPVTVNVRYSPETVSGDQMPRLNPMLAVRDQAAMKALELSKRFGLSPMDQISLFKDHAAAAGANALGGLFGRPPTPAQDSEQAPGATDGPDPVGIMSGFDSAPPSRPN